MLTGLLPFALLDAASTDPHTHEDWEMQFKPAPVSHKPSRVPVLIRVGC